jgi:uncharacterized protein (TIGR03086 family)
MEPAELFEACLAQATAVVRQARDDQFANATPDTEWNVRDLVGHMLYELSWVPDLVRGQTIEEVGSAYDGDLIGESADDLRERWQAAADLAKTAADEADLDQTAHLSYGEVTNAEYLRQVAADQLIHAWDLGKAIGMAVSFDPSVTQQVYEDTLPNEAMLRSSGLFGDKVAVPDDANLQTKLLALFGRRADWQSA